MIPFTRDSEIQTCDVAYFFIPGSKFFRFPKLIVSIVFSIVYHLDSYIDVRAILFNILGKLN